MLIQTIALALHLVSSPLSAERGHALPSSTFMTLGTPVAAPVGYLRFCLRRPDQCRNQAGPDLAPAPSTLRPATDGPEQSPLSMGPPDPETEAPFAEPESATLDQASPTARVILTERSWTALNEINRSINARLRPMSDEEAFGRSNYWTLPLEDEGRAVGNCKHFALEKRRALAEAGLPAAALSLAIVRTSAGELHAVLIVATNRGDLVLDNLSQKIRGWRELGYRWLARQIPGRPMDWVAGPAQA